MFLLLPLLISGALTATRLNLKDDDVTDIKRFNGKITCGQREYYNSETEKCTTCTSCREFMFERTPCRSQSDTVCEWCGIEIDEKTMSDSVIASFQNNCLMANLEFVDMKRLNNKKYKKVQLMSSREMETFEGDEDDYDDYKEDEYNENENNLENEKFERMIQAKVEEHFGLFGQDEMPEYDDISEPSIVLETSEVKKTFEKLIKVPIRQRAPPTLPPAPIVDYLDEEIQEDKVEWDSWVDDRVKPIEKIGELEALKETVIVDMKLEGDEANEKDNLQFFFIFFVSMFLTLCCCQALRYCIYKRRERTIELLPEHYQILAECGANAEKKMHMHGHENPLYLP
ncbi:unnamed protein product [Caenorhabditis bovis]|uniref:TNFR-Cys domain-containing protein n=1 Tax=Caenorhabditis bovis TaxID=2654633 RepID=A0A8S1EKJ9_9PELO|nr:unnamed protein product [Caenorhabditis bovis]